MSAPFRVMRIDLSEGKGRFEPFEGRETFIGGSGLAAGLFQKYGRCDLPWDDPSQPLIFAIGPLTGYFPLMSKVVCGFKSPYTDEFTESHAGGRLALAMRFANLDALVLTGKAKSLSVLTVGPKRIDIQDVHYLRGLDVFATGKHLRSVGRTAAGHRSTLRIGPAGEKGSAYACINVDTYRHFGRLGSGAVMGGKNVKGIVIQGEAAFDLPQSSSYAAFYKEVFTLLTTTEMMHKYHHLGTPVNMAALNKIQSLPWRNLQATADPNVDAVSGETFHRDLLLRQAACSGCPVGCIHIGLLRSLIPGEHEYLYKQVSYDHETVFSHGPMLGMTKAGRVLALLDETEKQGLDAISAGVALAWATEAFEKGLISEKDTIVPLAFDDVENYRRAVEHLGNATNDFYRLLAQGAGKAAKAYGGEDFACVLGQEMAGYATGEAYFISQALGFRHSHLDAGGYAFDQKNKDKDVGKVIAFLLDDERGRVMLTSLVSCLFARQAYSDETVKKALDSVGMTDLAEVLDSAVLGVQKLRWRLKLACGFDPTAVKIPKRFTEVSTWKGPVDAQFLDALKTAYAGEIVALAKD